MPGFRNRRDAGRSLGALLTTYASVHPLVLGLPPGGIPVAFEVARALDARLGVFAVRKPGVPEDAKVAARAPCVRDRHVILVDDGMATGASMLMAIRALRSEAPRMITVAVPVASRDALAMVRNQADDWACVITPEPFHEVGAWYEDFRQTTDEEVRELLARAQSGRQLAAR